MPPADNVSVLIGNKSFEGWSEVEVSHSIDAFSTITIKAPMEPENEDFRKWFVPFSFVPMKAYVGNTEFFRGTMLGVEPECTAEGRTVTATGYALPAVLGDCTLAYRDLPFEFNGITPEEILRQVAGRFGLGVDVRTDLGGPLKKKKYDPATVALEFLVKIVKERNAVLSNTPTGDLLCWQSVKPGNPVGLLHQENIPTIKSRFSSQDYYSEITGIGARRRKQDGSTFTEQNPFLNTIKRPLIFKVQNIEGDGGELSAKGRMGRMFANMAVYQLEDLPSWYIPDGSKLWERNTTVEVYAPNAMIYKAYEFLIRTVVFKENRNGRTTSLELALPGAFSGEIPKTLPWLPAETRFE